MMLYILAGLRKMYREAGSLVNRHRSNGGKDTKDQENERRYCLRGTEILQCISFIQKITKKKTEKCRERRNDAN